MAGRALPLPSASRLMMHAPKMLPTRTLGSTGKAYTTCTSHYARRCRRAGSTRTHSWRTLPLGCSRGRAISRARCQVSQTCDIAGRVRYRGWPRYRMLGCDIGEAVAISRAGPCDIPGGCDIACGLLYRKHLRYSIATCLRYRKFATACDSIAILQAACDIASFCDIARDIL